MISNVFSYFQSLREPARLTAWCKDKTEAEMREKFGERVVFSSPEDEPQRYLGISLNEGAIGCKMNGYGICTESYFFPDAAHITPNSPDIISNELKDQGHASGDEEINSALFLEYDLSTFTEEDWDKVRPVIVQAVCERGEMSDLYALVKRYGYDSVRDTIRNDIEVFSDMGGLYLASMLFYIPISEIKAVKDYLQTHTI
jgi:hypothetical protein